MKTSSHYYYVEIFLLPKGGIPTLINNQKEKLNRVYRENIWDGFPEDVVSLIEKTDFSNPIHFENEEDAKKLDFFVEFMFDEYEDRSTDELPYFNFTDLWLSEKESDQIKNSNSFMKDYLFQGRRFQTVSNKANTPFRTGWQCSKFSFIGPDEFETNYETGVERLDSVIKENIQRAKQDEYVLILCLV